MAVQLLQLLGVFLRVFLLRDRLVIAGSLAHKTALLGDVAVVTLVSIR